MWIPTRFETKPATLQPEQGPAFQGTELWVDGMQMSGAVERVDWEEDPIHLKTCKDCLGGDCADGAWLSARRAGSYVVFLPSFSRWLVDEWYEQGYEDPPAFLERGAMLLDQSLYAELRGLVPALPARGELQPLAGWEAVRLLRFEAPVEVLGRSSAPVAFQRDLLLRINWWGTDDMAVKTLEGLLATWTDSYEPVALKPLSQRNVPVPFDLARGDGSVEWQPLASGSGWDRLLLAPGYVVDEMPQLPTGEPTNALMVSTELHKATALRTEIWVDNVPLYDFVEQWLGVDLIELAASLCRDGEFFIITCSCGEAGCAGIRRGVDVFREDGKVYWVIHRRESADILVFDEEAYQSAVDTALVEFGHLYARHPEADPVPIQNRYLQQRLAELDEAQGES